VTFSITCHRDENFEHKQIEKSYFINPLYSTMVFMHIQGLVSIVKMLVQGLQVTVSVTNFHL
jgi:hypothetical protein